MERSSINSKEYEDRGWWRWLDNEAPEPEDFETTREVVPDSVTFKLGFDIYTVSALKRGHLTVERTGPPAEELPEPGSREHIFVSPNVNWSGAKIVAEGDPAVKLLSHRRQEPQGPPTQDPVLWARLEYLRKPLREIVFKVPRGLKIDERERRHLQERVEELLKGREGIGVPLEGAEDVAPKRWRLPWRR